MKIRRSIASLEFHKRLYRNIRYLAKKQKIRMQDIETTAGLSSGYLSRMCHGTGISASAVWKIAKMLKVDLDDLMHKDLKEEEKKEDSHG